VRGESATESFLIEPTSARHQTDKRVGELAQLGERLVCNQEVTGSSPVFSTSLRCAGVGPGGRAGRRRARSGRLPGREDKQGRGRPRWRADLADAARVSERIFDN
jgi:hypothetical protein